MQQAKLRGSSLTHPLVLRYLLTPHSRASMPDTAVVLQAFLTAHLVVWQLIHLSHMYMSCVSLSLLGCWSKCLKVDDAVITSITEPHQ